MKTIRLLKQKNIFNRLIIFIFIIILVNSSPLLSRVEALTLIQTADTGFDNTLLVGKFDITYKTKIIVTPIFIPNNGLKLTDQNWYKGILYYTVQKLGFGQLPFQYIVSSTGDIYASGTSDERKISVKNLGDNTIIIGYLAGNDLNGFNPSSEASLRGLLLDISNRNAISPSNISVSQLNFTRDETNRLVSISSSPIFGNWSIQLNTLIQTITTNYSPVVKSYSLTIESVTMPQNTINPNQTLTGSVKLKNTGSTTFYGAIDSNIIAVKSGNSQFYLNNTWLSESQFDLMPTNQNLTPGSEATYNFNFRAPLTYGNVSENFILKTLGGQIINSSPITINVNITKGSQDIAIINSTELNSVHVHDSPSTVSPVVGKAESGGRYLIIKTDPNGFIDIDLNNGTTGWIAGWLTTRL